MKTCDCGKICAPSARPQSECTPADRDRCGCGLNLESEMTDLISPAPLTGKHFTATRNACKLCAPLGACLAFRGIEGCIPFLHGSQGCATYIRRYMISHFRAPMDIASSRFGEESVVVGGRVNLFDGPRHGIEGYHPGVIGIATTCLAETIGDDVPMFLREFIAAHRNELSLPYLLHASTPSYSGSHAEGYQQAVRAIVDQLALDGPNEKFIGVFPGMVSPADLRHLREILDDFGMNFTLVPDYSDPLDGPVWGDYLRIPDGGTAVKEIRKLGRASAVIELASTLSDKQSAASLLDHKFSTAVFRVGLPIGIRQTDRFIRVLEQITGCPVPRRHAAERGRLIDAYVDGHKYTYGRKVAIYGDEDFVIGLTSFCAEIGLVPVLCASGGRSGRLEECIRSAAPELTSQTKILEGIDFADIEKAVIQLSPDLLLGNSKGYTLSRKSGIPLIRTGFPIHDRISGPRILHLGYRGAHRLFDTIVDKLMERKQESSEVGYTYI